MVMGRQLMMCLLALFQLGSQIPSASPKPIELCEVLEHLNLYAGKIVVIRTKWGGTLDGNCKRPQSLDDPRTVMPGKYLVNGIAIKPLSAEIRTDPERAALLNRQMDDMSNLDLAGYDVIATFTGRLEVKRPGGLGFGVQRSYPAQMALMRIDDIERTGEKHRVPKRIE